MIIVNSVDENYFTLNGIQYARIYQPLVQGTEDVGIYSIFDTRLQLMNSTKYDEYNIDGVFYPDQPSTVIALLLVIYSPAQAVTGSGRYNEIPSGDIDGVNVTFSTALIPVIDTVRVYANGIRQRLGIDYSIFANLITFTVAPMVGFDIRVDYDI